MWELASRIIHLIARSVSPGATAYLEHLDIITAVGSVIRRPPSLIDVPMMMKNAGHTVWNSAHPNMHIAARPC